MLPTRRFSFRYGAREIAESYVSANEASIVETKLVVYIMVRKIIVIICGDYYYQCD